CGRGCPQPATSTAAASAAIMRPATIRLPLPPLPAGPPPRRSPFHATALVPLVRVTKVHHIRAHPRLATLAAALAVCLVIVSVLAARSRTEGCSAAPPLPDLPAQLRSLGGFDQPYDATMRRTLEDAALQA